MIKNKEKFLNLIIFIVGALLFIGYELIDKAGLDYGDLLFSITFIVLLFIAVMALCRKISKNEKVLRENEEKYRTLFEGSSDAVMMLDENGFFDCNTATLKIFGFSNKEDFVKLHPRDVSPKYQPDGLDSETSANNKINEAFRKGSNHFEWIHRKMNGEEFYADVLLTEFNMRGRHVLQATVRDISGIKWIDKEYKNILNAAIDGFKITDMRGKFLEVNDALCRILGYSRDELLKMSIQDINAVETPEDIANRIREIKKNGFARFETRNRCKDGRILDVDVCAGYVGEGEEKLFAFTRDITERKRFEQELIETEERYHRLEDYAPFGIAIHSGGKFSYINAAGGKILGSDNPTSFAGKPVQDIVHPDYYRMFKDRMKLLEKGEVAPLAEEKFIRSNGTLIDAEVVSIPFSNKSKHAIYSIFYDITERKNFLNTLMRTNEFSKTVFNSMKDPLAVIDVQNFRIVDANDVFMKEYGLNKEDVIGRTCFEITHKLNGPCSSPEGRCPLFGTIITGLPSSAEHTHYGKNGEKIYVEISTSPIKDAEGKVVQIIHISRDITQKKIFEEKIRESEEKFRLTVQSASDAIILTDIDNDIISLNKSAIRLFGYGEDELRGKPFVTLLPDKYKETYKYGLEWMTSGDGARISERFIEMQGLNKNGKELAIDISIAEWKTTSGTYHVSIIRDVEERKRLMEEISRINLDLKRTERIKTQFLGVVAHELKTPITPIKAQLQMILGGYFGSVTEKQKTGLEMILRNASRLDRLIGDILDISKLEAGVMTFSMRNANLNELVRNAVETMMPKADDKKINLTLKEDMIKNIPDMLMDTDRITQVVINLVNNAIKFTEPGGSINVEISYTHENACVKIKDTGVGINKEDQDKLFQPFVQVSSKVAQKAEGTGLGLAISKGIITSHLGKIWIESEPGKGSTFQFTIPLKNETTGKESEIILFDKG